MDLIAKLEAATGPSRELDYEIALAVGWSRNPYGRGWLAANGDLCDAPPCLTASIDAALTLVPEGWHIECLSTPDKGTSVRNPSRKAACDMGPDLDNDEGWEIGRKVGNHAEAALAVCIAALKAREAK